ncbi:MAG: hypothetical protein E3J56_01120 [Candidatus Aminicenantes bacterium]|nr:MAG: hypothetical protein E3J56_01120 [Candidatus Aminicenantes bacterium]
MKIDVKLKLKNGGHFFFNTDDPETWKFYSEIVDRLLEFEETEFHPDGKVVDFTTPGYPKPITAKKVDRRKYPDHVRKKPRKKSPIKFPLEMKVFVKNRLHLRNKEIAEEVNKRFGLDMNLKNISDYLRSRNIVRKPGQKQPPSATKFTPAVDRYIKDHSTDMSSEDLAAALKRIFKIDTTSGSVQNRKSIIGAKKRFHPTKYTKEFRDFLKSNIDKMKNQELLEAANKEFNLNLDFNRLKGHLKYYKIKRSKTPLEKSDEDESEKTTDDLDEEIDELGLDN